MKTIVSIADLPVRPRKRDSTTLREAIPFWFAVSSPLIGLMLGVFGAWLVAWLTT